MRVLVCGGRNFGKVGLMRRVLAQVEPTVILTGGARGADTLAKAWARAHDIPYFECEAPWKEHGKAAGAIRNQWMIKHFPVDLVLAFEGGPGTRNMIAAAETHGVKVTQVGS